MIGPRAALFLRAVETLDVVAVEEIEPPCTWIWIERAEFDGLEPTPFVCGTERHEGAGIGADFVEALVAAEECRLAFWHTCSACHNTMRASYTT